MNRLSIAAVLVLTVLALAPAVASADAGVQMGAGASYAVREFPGAPLHRCAMGAVGTDDQGRRLGLTAGHCGRVGSEVFSVDGRTRIGTVVTAKRFPGNGVCTFEALDYAFVEFDRTVVFADTPGSPAAIRTIGPPVDGQIVCKYGDGFLAGGERCGIVDRVAPREFSALLFGNFGDSGAPVYRDRTVLIGLLSRPSGLPFLSGVIMTRADSAIRDAAARRWIGGTFRPLH